MFCGLLRYFFNYGIYSMKDLILHQYASSPFSEKVRSLLGYKKQSYSVVEIPVIMPKPDLIALTGGYRKTPVLQIGADIYCDTSIICRLIDRLYPESSVYPDEHLATLGAGVHWTDTFLFKIAVAVAFQPKAIGGSDLFNDASGAEAFMADRAALTKGSNELGIALEIALPHWETHMRRLERQLSDATFLGGVAPNILDFSTYHCCWFVYKNDILKSDLEDFPSLAAWMSAMAGFGQGQSASISGASAVEVAKNNSIAALGNIQGTLATDCSAGDMVEVMPIDYGFQPTRGELLMASAEEIIVRRGDERAGEVAVHFPRLGFQINKVV
jgi:glutathione S-transferase